MIDSRYSNNTYPGPSSLVEAPVLLVLLVLPVVWPALDSQPHSWVVAAVPVAAPLTVARLAPETQGRARLRVAARVVAPRECLASMILSGKKEAIIIQWNLVTFCENLVTCCDFMWLHKKHCDILWHVFDISTLSQFSMSSGGTLASFSSLASLSFPSSSKPSLKFEAVGEVSWFHGIPNSVTSSKALHPTSDQSML